MNSFTPRVLVLLTFVLLTGQAMAIPTLTSVTPTFSQASGNGKVNAGLVVIARTNLAVLAVGGGFTIECTSSPTTQNVERLVTVNNPLGATVSLNVPQVIPSQYTIINWSSIPAGTCGGANGQCIMQWKGQARDEAVDISIGLGGTGVNFQLIPAGEASESGPNVISICRYGQPQCCTNPCQEP